VINLFNKGEGKRDNAQFFSSIPARIAFYSLDSGIGELLLSSSRSKSENSPLLDASRFTDSSPNIAFIIDKYRCPKMPAIKLSTFFDLHLEAHFIKG
jgi:hypothetical protein